MSELAVLSDIHMRPGYREPVTEALETIRDRLATAHDVSHTVVLGDLIEDTDDPEMDRENVQSVASLLESGPESVTYLLGNHDIGSLSRSELSELLHQDQFYGRFDIDGTPFVYLDSTVTGAWARGALGTEQLDWVDENLPMDTIVLLHHSVGDFSLAENVFFEEWPERAYLWDRKELLARAGNRIRGTLSGHIHRTEDTTLEGIQHGSIDAISKKATTPEPATPSYAVISLSGPPTVKTYVGSTETASWSFE